MKGKDVINFIKENNLEDSTVIIQEGNIPYKSDEIELSKQLINLGKKWGYRTYLCLNFKIPITKLRSRSVSRLTIKK